MQNEAKWYDAMHQQVSEPYRPSQWDERIMSGGIDASDPILPLYPYPQKMSTTGDLYAKRSG